MRFRRALVLVIVTTAVSALQAQAPPSPRFDLSVDHIMRGPELVGYPPSGLRWSGDSARLYFEWRRPGEDEAATYVVGREGGTPTKLSERDRLSAPFVSGQWSADRRRILGVDRGDIVVIDTVAKRRLEVTRTTATESSPRWARNETAVTFLRDNNLYLVSLGADATAGLQQLTDVQTKRTDTPVTDSQRVLRKEEASLLTWVEQEKARRQRREARDRARELPKFELAERQSVTDAALSADGRTAFLMVTERARSRTADVARFVNESGYVDTISPRTNVGDAQDARKLAVVNLATGESAWAGVASILEPVKIPKVVPFDPDAAKPEQKGEGEGDAKPAPSAKGRDVRWGALLLSPDGTHAIASVRAGDNTDRWLVAVNPSTGAGTVLDHVHDEAWVREIGPQSNIDGGLGWLPDNRRIWFLAERDGWMQLYTVDATAATPAATAITAGAFEIDSVQVSAKGDRFYVQSTEQHPGERHLYAVSVDGGTRTKLTSTAGAHDGTISPDDATFGLVSSSSNRPPEVFVMANRVGATAAAVTTSYSPEWATYTWVEPQLVTYKARDGVEVYARLYTPEMVGAKRDPKAPAVVFVHGAGYLQNAHRYWSSYQNEYMFHHLLASRGYVVLDPDYRGSAGYGRDWRTAIYRWMGGHDLNDVVDGAKYLAATQRVNPKRIGVYGGSYGGFITLMAMFTSPDTFAAGAALRPVTDWAHYNHSYTANILNEPQDDIEAYRKSSPIYFADGLKGALLICHGMVDTNVHFEDSVRLTQKLIELRKENWELAVYPVENHGFIEPSSWADEYRRILKLFETNLKRP